MLGHVINYLYSVGLSFILFKGGIGEWKSYLDVSNAWLGGQRENILGNIGKSCHCSGLGMSVN